MVAFLLYFLSDDLLVSPVPELPGGSSTLHGDPPPLVTPPGHVPRPPLPSTLTLHIRLQKPKDQVSSSFHIHLQEPEDQVGSSVHIHLQEQQDQVSSSVHFHLQEPKDQVDSSVHIHLQVSFILLE